MKKRHFLWVSCSLLLAGCQPIEEWQTIGERPEAVVIKNNILYQPESLYFKTTSLTIQSVVHENNQLVVTIDWLNEGTTPQTFFDCYESFNIYADERPLTLVDSSESAEKNPVDAQQTVSLTFTFEDSQAEILLLEAKPMTETAKHYDIYLE
ncbi:hypothetical protein BAU15_03905 [Enterococcus sp. JM4C]|uniref:hypothetical protein n=1 Tax=Candidatus Enterococcus huntleyi TaxID=1857217 RepID=UPI00137B275C|nr:hypothetical protein [Enterococcus sp. JM4C]KAF1295692.1 hypothetical protein BAU15_03905 [Enterococcus sp. JM4C]